MKAVRAPLPYMLALSLASAAWAAAPSAVVAQEPQDADDGATAAHAAAASSFSAPASDPLASVATPAGDHPDTGHAGAGVSAADAAARRAEPARRPDFLFGRPGLTLGVRGGMGLARARSDIFEFMTDELTLERSDFNAVSLIGEADVWLSPRLDLVLGLGYSNASAPSEYRDWVDEEDDLPVRQRSKLRQVPLTGGLKVYLTPRGESLGRFAWIPTRTAFYAGAGGGFVRHSFRQSGEFIEIDEAGDAWIVEDTLRSAGWSPTAHLFGGVDYSLGPRAVVSAEARQSWASAELDERDYRGFEPIDLSGLQLTLGIRWRL